MRARLLLTSCFLSALAAASLSPGAAVDPPPPGSFTIAVLPDTQNYSQSYPHIFEAQTLWIRDNRVAHEIVYTLHLGDVTNNNSSGQWNIARTAMGLLDGQVPYAVSPGNHDYGPTGNASTRESLFNSPTYFGPGSPYANQPSLGGVYEAGKTDNSWHLFTAGGRDWIVLALEFGPRDEVVAWADQVLDGFPDRTAIVITHAYMYFDETRYDYGLRAGTQSWNPHNYGVSQLPGGVNDGQELWNAFIREHDVALVLNGHVLGDGTGRLASVGEQGQVVHQLLSNYQSGVDGSMNGGDGYLRLLRFLPDGRTVEVLTYSPFLDETMDEPDQRFTLGLFNEPIERVASRAVLADEPVLYYRLEKESGPLVHNLGSAGEALDGNYVGPGPGAAEFDGSGEVQLFNAPATAEEWSIAAWVRTTTLASQTVLSNDRDGWNDDVLFGLAPDGAATPASRWAIVHHDDGLQVRSAAVDSIDAVPGRWYHLVASCDGNRLQLFVDGELVDQSLAVGLDLDFEGAPTRVGRSFESSANGWPFEGSIAEVSLFDRALDATDVLEQRTATLRRVVGGELLAVAPTDPGTNDPVPTLVEHTAFPGIGAPGSNEGDARVALANRGLNLRDGVLLATVSENERDGLRATVEVGWNSFSDGALTLSITQAGFAGGLNEVNFDAAVAWFPFAAGWRGAHVEGDGTVFDGQDVDSGMLTNLGDGRHVLDLGVDSRADGMLFTIGGENEDNIVPSGVLSDGSGWDLRVQDNAANFAATGEPNRFGFLYVPYDTPSLIGGRYDGFSDSHLQSVGSFAMVRAGVGSYRLTIPGGSPDSGLLALCVSYLATSGPTTAPDDNVLSYEDDGTGSFLIESRDLPSLNPQDTQFVWAFVPWALHSDVATNYCVGAPNSAGAGASMGWDGSVSVSANDFTLTAAGAPPGQPGLFIYAPNAIELPFGDGFLCLGGAIVRANPPTVIDPSGAAQRLLDLTLPPAVDQIDPGETWRFQFWYRDPNGPGGTGVNLSDGLEVVFCP